MQEAKNIWREREREREAERHLNELCGYLSGLLWGVRDDVKGGEEWRKRVK